jgi:hypothetical protein
MNIVSSPEGLYQRPVVAGHNSARLRNNVVLPMPDDVEVFGSQRGQQCDSRGTDGGLPYAGTIRSAGRDAGTRSAGRNAGTRSAGRDAGTRSAAADDNSDNLDNPDNDDVAADNSDDSVAAAIAGRGGWRPSLVRRLLDPRGWSSKGASRPAWENCPATRSRH